jgi:hypothetical protein
MNNVCGTIFVKDKSRVYPHRPPHPLPPFVFLVRALTQQAFHLLVTQWCNCSSRATSREHAQQLYIFIFPGGNRLWAAAHVTVLTWSFARSGPINADEISLNNCDGRVRKMRSSYWAASKEIRELGRGGNRGQRSARKRAAHEGSIDGCD